MGVWGDLDMNDFLLEVNYYAMMNQHLAALTQKLAAQLSQNELKICTAESCTGGLIAKTCTDLAGSSDWFDRGLVTYSNQAKVELLGVSAETLQHHGAVSQQTVREMVQGAHSRSAVDVAIAVTGIAGPGGGSTEKPVGLVWFGFAVGADIRCEQQLFSGNRDQIRMQSTAYALSRIIDLLDTWKT